MRDLTPNQRAEVFLAYLRGEDISKFGYDQETYNDIIMRFEDMQFEEQYEMVNRELIYIMFEEDGNLLIETRDAFEYEDEDEKLIFKTNSADEMTDFFNSYCQKLIDNNGRNV